MDSKWIGQSIFSVKNEVLNSRLKELNLYEKWSNNKKKFATEWDEKSKLLAAAGKRKCHGSNSRGRGKTRPKLGDVKYLIHGHQVNV